MVAQLLMGLEDNLEYMMWLGEQRLIRDRVLTLKEIVANIQRVTKKEVDQMAREIFTRDNLHLSAIGPKLNEDRLSSLLAGF